MDRMKNVTEPETSRKTAIGKEELLRWTHKINSSLK